MKFTTYIALAVGCGLVPAVGLGARAAPQADKQKPPAQQQPAQKPPANSNQFPEDTSNVPVVPTTAEPAAPPAAAPAAGEPAVNTSLLKNDSDPVHSPDDPLGDESSSDGFSSSLTGSNDVNIPDDVPAKHRRGQAEPAVHQETAKEDESVGDYELSRKNWKAALSRYQSALVTDSENPDLYWGIAEAQRGLGDYANAKANYQKVVDYDDPESKHSKEAKKLLKSPQLANAPAVSANQAQPR